MILYLISELDVGGAETALFNLVTHLDRERFGQPVVACLWGRGEVGRWLADAGVEVISLGSSKAGLLRAVLRVRRLLRSGRFRLIHSFLFHANIAGRIAAAGTGVPAISAIRVMEVDRPLRVTLDRLTHRWAAAETCVSETVRRWSIERGLPAEKLVAIPNGIDCTRPAAPPAGLRRELGLADDAKIALFVGRLHRQKGPDLLLDAAVRLRQRLPGLHFVLAGDGPMAGKLADDAERAGILPQFHLLGRRDDVLRLMADADLFVLPSRWEGMPNAVLEAMAAGLPVVAADVGGCGELVVNGTTGILAAPEDAQQLADAIAKIAADPALAERMGGAGRERACGEFTVERMVRANEELYERVMGGRPGDAAT